MKLDTFLIIGLIVNVLFAVVFPTQIFGDDPFGLTEIESNKNELAQYYTVNGTSIITGYNDETGELIVNDDTFTDMAGVVSSTEGDSGLFGSDTFAFVDWVKVGFSSIKTILMFLVGFIKLLLFLPTPLNILIGIPFSLLYVYSIVSFIMGRA